MRYDQTITSLPQSAEWCISIIKYRVKTKCQLLNEQREASIHKSAKTKPAMFSRLATLTLDRKINAFTGLIVWNICMSSLVILAASVFEIPAEKQTDSNELRYLGVFLTASREFRCSYNNVIRSFYRAKKVGRCASEEVIVELLKMKCLPVPFYGLESCPLSKSQIKSLDFAINSAFSKIFSTKSQDIIDNCRTVFNCQPLADSLSMRKKKTSWVNILIHVILFA